MTSKIKHLERKILQILAAIPTSFCLINREDRVQKSQPFQAGNQVWLKVLTVEGQTDQDNFLLGVKLPCNLSKVRGNLYKEYIRLTYVMKMTQRIVMTMTPMKYRSQALI